MAKSLMTVLKSKDEHSLVDAIYNQKLLVPVGVVKALKICSQSKGELVDLKDLYIADYDKFIDKAVDSYLQKQKSKVIAKLGKKAMKKINGELEEDYVDRVSCMYGNEEIIMNFCHRTEVIQFENGSWIDADSSHDMPEKSLHIASEDIEVLINQ